jgi:HEAT repeat protein
VPEEDNSNIVNRENCRLADTVDTERATDLIKSLAKVRKNLHMYPDNHPMYQKTVDDFCLKMSSVVEGETIQVRINQYDILFNDEVIYHSKDRDESLALFFFKDGLKELSFLKGIRGDEIKDFLEIISLDFEKDVLDDDIVTLLWEKDFQHIKYIVDDTFLLENEGYEQIATEQAKSVTGGNAGIMKAYENVLSAGDVSKVDIIPLGNEDIKIIVKTIENDPPDKTYILIRVLFEMLHLAEEKTEYEEIVKCIKEALNYAVYNANIEIVNYVLSKIKSKSKTSVYPEHVIALLNNIENYINSATFIKLFGQVIDGGAEIPDELLEELKSYLGVSSIPQFISILGQLENMSSRRIVINILTEVGAKDIVLLAKGLNDSKWYVVRNVVYIFRQIADRKSVEYLINVAGHSDKRVRKEVVHALGELGTEHVLDVLKERLSDEDKSIRIAAFVAVGSIGTPLAKSMILEIIGSTNFRDKSFPEKKEIFKVLSRWKEEDVINFLIRITKKWTFFRRTKNNETRAAALHCLGLIGADNVRPAIEKFKKSHNNFLRTQALEILRKS